MDRLLSFRLADLIGPGVNDRITVEVVEIGRAVQRSIHDAHGEDCTDSAEGDAMPTI